MVSAPERDARPAGRGPRGARLTPSPADRAGSGRGVIAAGAARWRTFAARIDAGTPPERERTADALRALAIAGVLIGHWLVGGFAIAADGGLRIASPLSTLPGLAPASWVLQMLGLFFLVGGYSSTLSRERSAARGTSYSGWLRDRLVRLLRPVVAVTALWAVALPLLAASGTPASTLRTTVVLVLQPLWFIGVYLVITALTPLALAADRRFGAWAALPPVLVVLVVDALRYGPYGEAMPAWLGLVNLIPAWWFGYQLGVAWARGRLGRPLAVVMIVVGAGAFALLIAKLGYPASMVGVPGVDRSNSNPPSLLVPALAAVQCGLALLLRDRLERALRRPALWAAVAVANLSAMTFFCWHQTAMLAVTLPVFAGAGPVPGLIGVPEGPGWVLLRAAWIGGFAVMMAVLWAVMRRFDGPWTGVRLPLRALAGALAIGYAGLAVLVY
ncbi:MAG: acyltransferase family protein [Streptosporangiales bacterium]|nr:acyltransferase family protein [Streptosporangiales bacterium]